MKRFYGRRGSTTCLCDLRGLKRRIIASESRHYVDSVSIVAPKTISMDMSVVSIMAMMRSKTP